MRDDQALQLVAVAIAWIAMLGATGALLAWGIAQVASGGAL